jgi:alkylation response protein AidB-like acyl-CoA dehydrogenase
LFVPERFLCNIRPPARRPGVLRRRSTNFLPKVSGVPLGAARAAIEYAVDAIKNRVEIPSGRPLRNSGRIQNVIADAEMMLGAARSYVFHAMEREWTRLENNEQPTIRERADAWLSRVNAAQSAREIVRMLYDAMGSASIYSERSPLDRALRDAETVCQHIVMQRKTLGMAGAMLLEADTPLLPYI